MKRGFIWVGLMALAVTGCSAMRERQEARQTQAPKGPKFLKGFDDEYNSMKQRTSYMGMPSRPMSAEDMLKNQ